MPFTRHKKKKTRKQEGKQKEKTIKIFVNFKIKAKLILAD